MASPEYDIATIEDFTKVPNDRLAQCLAEFCAFMQEVRPLMAHGLAPESFTWIDDGIPMIRGVNLSVNGQEEFLPNPNFPK